MATTEAVKWQEARVNIRLKLSALWTSVMFFYVYADLLGFFDATAMGEIMKGNMGFLGPATQELKLGVAVMLSIPAIMILLSLVLKANHSRWANIVIGVIYALAAIATLILPSSLHYKYFESLELLFTGCVVWSAWKWPMQNAAAPLPPQL
jgi:Family of unknown function (DUF6326)